MKNAMFDAAMRYRNDYDLSPLALCPPTHSCGAPGKVPHTKGWHFNGWSAEVCSATRILQMIQGEAVNYTL